MKRYFILLFLLLSTPLFAQITPELSSTKLFQVKPDKKSKLQEIEIKTYTFKEHYNSNPEYPSFEVGYEILQIVNPKKLASIEKINKALEKTSKKTADDFNDKYPNWKESAKECLDCGTYSWSFSSSYEYIYSDNNIISIGEGDWYYTGGVHGFGRYTPRVYSLHSGEVLNAKVDDLVYFVDDEKLIALLRKKLRASKRGVFPKSDDKISYFDFDNIRLNDNYEVNASGISFLYNQYEIAPYSDGIINIRFTFDELKPFVKKNSELYYLFE